MPSHLDIAKLHSIQAKMKKLRQNSEFETIRWLSKKLDTEWASQIAALSTGANNPGLPTTNQRGFDPEGDYEWGTPEALVVLYNTLTPEECSAVLKLTPARVKRAKDYLAPFPGRDFWAQVFENIGRSDFLRGKRNAQGHESFRASFDWLLSKGRDGTENCVKVFEGKYGNG